MPKIEVVRKQPAPPPVVCVRIELTIEEAQRLADNLGRQHCGSAFDVYRALAQALDEAAGTE